METTPKTHIVRQLRQLWLRSKERSIALKNSKYCCEICGVKKTKTKNKVQKIEVHHKHGITNWDIIVEVIRKELLCDPKDLQALCPECHDKI